MANNRFKLENTLIRSYAHLRSFKFKAYFKATKDLHLEGLPDKYESGSMTRMQGSLFLTSIDCSNVLRVAFTKKTPSTF